MKTVALFKVRNERWVLGASLRSAMRLCDAAVVLDHASTDETPEIVRSVAGEYPGLVTLIRDDRAEWTEASLLEKLLHAGRDIGGTHFLVLDADEILTGNLISDLPLMLRMLQPGASLWLPLPAIWGSLDAYRDDDSVWSTGQVLVGFHDAPWVTYESHAGGYDIHTRFPSSLRRREFRPLHLHADGGLMHLQFANRRRLIAKHAWYKMIEAVRWPGRSTAEQINAYYDRAVEDQYVATTKTPASWWQPWDDFRTHIDLHDEPWHEAECRRLWRQHGAGVFAGLDLYGVPERVIRASGAGEPKMAGEAYAC